MFHVDLANIADKASEVVQTACRFNGDENKKGGYLCIADNEGVVHAVILVGEVPDTYKRRRYFALCLEKAHRLGLQTEHQSSWQSRDEAKDKWAGAVRVREFILSFSGLPDLWDEAIVLAVAHNNRSRLISRENLERIVAVSNNPHVRQLVAKTTGEPPCSDPAS